MVVKQLHLHMRDRRSDDSKDEISTFAQLPYQTKSFMNTKHMTPSKTEQQNLTPTEVSETRTFINTGTKEIKSEDSIHHGENECCDQRNCESDSKSQSCNNTNTEQKESREVKTESFRDESKDKPQGTSCANKSTGEDSIIADIKDDDVICGRGAGTHHHPGNKVFRHLVQQYQPLYAEANILDKSNIASWIVHSVGRFLRQNEDTWYDIGYKAAKEKTCQALREKQHDRHSSSPLKTVEYSKETMNEVEMSPKSMDIGDNDVLLGRGGVTNSHVGNVRFRKLVQEFQPKYLDSPKKLKRFVAKDIVQVIHSRGGRFLLLVNNTWREVDDQRAREKTSQALRENAPVIRQMMKESRSDNIQQIGPLRQDTRTFKQNLTPLSPYQENMKNYLRSSSDRFGFDPYQRSYPRHTIAQYEHQHHPYAIQQFYQPSTNQVRAQDVLYGRGAGINNHPGNVYFRRLVHEHQRVYADAPKLMKRKIAMNIVTLVHSCGGRFLNRSRSGGWTTVPLEKAREKVSQALREKSSQSH